MPEVPNNDSSYWLFADDLTDKSVFEFVEFRPNYKTRSNKEIPVFVLLGSNKERTGEFLLSTWNVVNLDEIKAKFGSNSDTWGTPKFKAIEENGKIRLEVV